MSEPVIYLILGAIGTGLAGIGWAIWQVIQWMRNDVASPLVSRAVSLMSKMELHLEALDKTMPVYANMIVDIKEKIDKATGDLSDIKRSSGESLKALESNGESIDGLRAAITTACKARPA